MPSAHRRPRAARLAVAALAMMLLCPGSVWAKSWIKDPRRMHVGAHGRLSCLECHEAIPGRDHPNPARVNASPRRGMKPERCYECHPEIQEGLRAGKHGEMRIKGEARFRECVACHDPHYGRRRGADKPGKFQSGLPWRKQCGACHPKRETVPGPSPGDKACWSCHAAAPAGRGAGPHKTASLCLQCHGGRKAAGGSAPVPAGGEADLGAHQGLDCSACHKKAARFPHNRQSLVGCLECHPPHGEKTAGGDAHIRVGCSACHFANLTPTAVGGEVVGEFQWKGGRFRQVHKLASTDGEKFCSRCHHAGNQVGAAEMIPPPKGLLCMPCHRAVLALDDWPSRIGMGVFLLGLLMTAGVWLGGRRPHATQHGRDRTGGFWLGAALKAFILDGLLQRRLWRRSPARGLIHSLIFLPFGLRFLYGLAGLVLSLWQPQWRLSQALLDKNYPLTAFFFDFTGVMVLSGALLAMIRRLRNRGQELSGTPRPDWAAIALLIGVTALGFVLEAVRIAMTGFPPGCGWAFLGAGLAGAIPPGGGGALYGYLWYAHAVLWAAFAAYLPFSRMLHILVAPLVLAGRAAREARRKS